MKWPTQEKVARAVVIALRALVVALFAALLDAELPDGLGTFFGSFWNSLLLLP